jgi:hypothetical protein
MNSIPPKPPGRWSQQETMLLAEMRRILSVELTSRLPLPDVVGIIIIIIIIIVITITIITIIIIIFIIR